MRARLLNEAAVNRGHHLPSGQATALGHAAVVRCVVTGGTQIGVDVVCVSLPAYDDIARTGVHLTFAHRDGVLILSAPGVGLLPIDPGSHDHA